MTEAPTPRSGPTGDRPATPVLQLRCRLDAPGPPGAERRLHLVAELYERQGSRWTRLTCRVGPVPVEELVHGEGWLQAVKELLWYLDQPPAVLDLTDGETPP